MLRVIIINTARIGFFQNSFACQTSFTTDTASRLSRICYVAIVQVLYDSTKSGAEQ